MKKWSHQTNTPSINNIDNSSLFNFISGSSISYSKPWEFAVVQHNLCDGRKPGTLRARWLVQNKHVGNVQRAITKAGEINVSEYRKCIQMAPVVKKKKRDFVSFDDDDDMQEGDCSEEEESD